MKPLYDVLCTRAEEGKLRFHMPGHKGKDVINSRLAGASRLDFTELYGTGNLYDGAYPIADAEALAASAWGVKHAYFLTGGATQGLYAAVKLLVKPGDTVLMDRGCHKSVYRALALVGAGAEYLYPDYLQPYQVPGALTADQVRDALCKNPGISCVVLTCPTYYGVVCDIAEISEVIHEHRAKLIVDQAHGAHFPFVEGMKSAVSLGADLAVCSMHKTLPALGQAALLCTNEEVSPRTVRGATSLFGTSSPSYAVMASMDATRAYMEEQGASRCKELAHVLRGMRKEINSRGVFRALEIQGDPLRLCVCTAQSGLSGYTAARILEENYRVVCEMADSRNVLFIITPADSENDLEELDKALYSLEKHAGETQTIPAISLPKARVAVNLRAALFGESREMRLDEAEGQTAAENLCPYPPGIPVIAAGEVIGRAQLAYLYENGFSPDDPVSVLT